MLSNIKMTLISNNFHTIVDDYFVLYDVLLKLGFMKLGKIVAVAIILQRLKLPFQRKNYYGSLFIYKKIKLGYPV